MDFDELENKINNMNLNFNDKNVVLNLISSLKKYKRYIPTTIFKDITSFIDIFINRQFIEISDVKNLETISLLKYSE